MPPASGRALGWSAHGIRSSATLPGPAGRHAQHPPRRAHIRNAIALIGAALVVGLASAGPAAALTAFGVQDDRLNSDGEHLSDRLDLLEASRAKVTRHDVLWSQVAPTRPDDPTDPEDPAYRFGHLDAVVRGLAERDIVPILVVYSTPTWAADTGGPAHGTSNSQAFAPSPAQFAAFMKALATRYNGRYRPDGGERLPEVRHWELWNEPNLGAFLSPSSARDARTACATTCAWWAGRTR